MFSQVSVCRQGRRCTPPPCQADNPLGSHPPPPWADTRPQADTPRQKPTPPPRDGYCSGRYASYWNVFLFIIILELLRTLSKVFILVKIHIEIKKRYAPKCGSGEERSSSASKFWSFLYEPLKKNREGRNVKRISSQWLKHSLIISNTVGYNSTFCLYHIQMSVRNVKI